MANNIKRRLDRVLDVLNDSNISREAFKKFKDVTPIKTGNAKRNTRLENNTINADYSYAQVLDKGRHMTNRGMRGSKQAPKGMSDPTLDHIRQYVFTRLGIKIK